MAIKVASTVINDSQQLQNIASLDSTIVRGSTSTATTSLTHVWAEVLSLCTAWVCYW